MASGAEASLAAPDLDNIAAWRRALDRRVVGGVGWAVRALRRHWLLLFNLAAGLTLLGALAAPVLDALELSAPAAAIRTAYLLLCPQRAAHSYFLFGHQLALEQRPLAMVAAQLLGGLAYAVARPRLAPLGWLPFVALSLPMAWDVLSQTVGLRTSDWLARTWTGALFNLAFVAWFYPRMDRASGRRAAGPVRPPGAD